METPMRLRTFGLLGALAAIGLLAACNGGDEDATPVPTAAVEMTPAPTATPFASVPEPILVTSEGIPGGGGPSGSETSAEYVVEAGDTIGGIAERFGVEADVIRQANEIEGDDIFVGQTLLIPRGGSVPPGADSSPNTSTDDEATDSDGDEADPDSTPSTPSVDTDGTYTVQAGDTAFGLALAFDVTVEALAEANDMTEDEITDLQIGQVINVPSPE